jgi:excisionase family DNA binding protein
MILEDYTIPLTPDVLRTAQCKLEDGDSLSAIARELNVNYEALRKTALRKKWYRKQDRPRARNITTTDPVTLSPLTRTTSVAPLALTRQQAAKALGISIPTVDRLVSEGLLRPSRACRRPLFPVSELERFLADTTKL